MRDGRAARSGVLERSRDVLHAAGATAAGSPPAGDEANGKTAAASCTPEKLKPSIARRWRLLRAARNVGVAPASLAVSLAAPVMALGEAGEVVAAVPVDDAQGTKPSGPSGA